MENIQISVIVPIYNVEAYLKRCINSIQEQSYKNIEIILVDDGSTDKSGEICDDYTKTDSRIKVFHKKNDDVEPRNIGVQKATSNWIVFVDSDDYVEKDYVLDLYNLLNRCKSEMAVTKAQRQYEDKAVKKEDNRFSHYIQYGIDSLFEVYAGKNAGFTLWGKIFKREHLLKYPLRKGIGEDFKGLLPILCSCKSVAFGDYRYNYHYIYREGSYVSQKFDRKRLSLFEDCKEMSNFLFGKFGENKDTIVLSTMFYQTMTVSLLNLQRMKYDSFSEVFNLYKPLFRKNHKVVMKSAKVNIKYKTFNLLLCSNWRLFLLQKKMRKHTGT